MGYPYNITKSDERNKDVTETCINFPAIIFVREYLSGTMKLP